MWVLINSRNLFFKCHELEQILSHRTVIILFIIIFTVCFKVQLKVKDANNNNKYDKTKCIFNVTFQKTATL